MALKHAIKAALKLGCGNDLFPPALRRALQQGEGTGRVPSADVALTNFQYQQIAMLPRNCIIAFFFQVWKPSDIFSQGLVSMEETHSLSWLAFSGLQREIIFTLLTTIINPTASWEPVEFLCVFLVLRFFQNVTLLTGQRGALSCCDSLILSKWADCPTALLNHSCHEEGLPSV